MLVHLALLLNAGGVPAPISTVPVSMTSLSLATAKYRDIRGVSRTTSASIAIAKPSPAASRGKITSASIAIAKSRSA